MDDEALDIYAKLAARQAITQYGTYARNLNLTKWELIKLIRKVAEHAAQIVNQEFT